MKSYGQALADWMQLRAEYGDKWTIERLVSHVQNLEAKLERAKRNENRENQRRHKPVNR